MVDYFLFDLDGTITMEELLPRIARKIGVWDEIYELTKHTIAGDIPFEVSLRHRVEILSRAKVSEIRKIVAGVELNPDILRFIQKNKHKCYIVTGNLDVWISELVERIDIPVLCSMVSIKDDMITSLRTVLNKREAAQSFQGNFVAIGEGANDYGMFELASESIAYGGVHEPARQLLEIATYLTYRSDTLCNILSQL